MYPICKIKNNTNDILRLHEYEFPPYGVFDIDDSKREGWYSNEDVITAITDSTVKILDEDNVPLSASDGIRLLKGTQVLTLIPCFQASHHGVVNDNQYMALSDNLFMSDTVGWVAPATGFITGVSIGRDNTDTSRIEIRKNGQVTSAQLVTSAKSAHIYGLSVSFNGGDCISIYVGSGKIRNGVITVFCSWSE
jgi:hypothetical protein